MKNKKKNIKNSKDYSNVDFGEHVGDSETFARKKAIALKASVLIGSSMPVGMEENLYLNQN